MKIQRLAKCDYEQYCFKPTFDISEGLKNNTLIKNEYDKTMFNRMVGEYMSDPNHFGVKMRFINLHPELQELYDWMTAKTPKLDSSEFEYKFRHRLVWIVNGLTDFPLCPVCGKKIGFEDNRTCWSAVHDPQYPGSGAFNYKVHCCKLHAEMDPEHQKLVEAGVMASLGVTHPMKDRKIQKKVFAKGIETYRARTGYDTHFDNPEYQDENRRRLRRNLEDAEKHRQIVEKTRKTRSEWSQEKKADIERRRQESRVKSVGSVNYRWGKSYYEFDGMTFDSSWEIYVWLWFRDTGHRIEKNLARFEYTANGKTHGYYPDFVIDGIVTEVKGDQFFSVYGDPASPMWYPYNRKTMDQLKLLALDNEAYAKWKCMLDNKVRILVWKDIAPMKEYVGRKYGKGYAFNFQRKRQKS